MRDTRFVLDPSRLPRRLTLELNPAVLAALESLSQRTGRSIDELALEFIDRAMQEPPAAGQSPVG